MSGKPGISSGALLNALLSMMLVVFIALKVAGVVTWAWWIVLAPLWGPLLCMLLLALIAVIVGWSVVWFVDWQTGGGSTGARKDFTCGN